jgi:hypothetical protein
MVISGVGTTKTLEARRLDALSVFDLAGAFVPSWSVTSATHPVERFGSIGRKTGEGPELRPMDFGLRC